MRYLILLTALFLAFTYGQAQLPGPGNCLGFTAVGQQAGIAHASQLSPTTALSIEGWFLPTVTSPTCCANGLINKSDFSSLMTGYALETGNQGDLRFSIGHAGALQVLDAPGSIFPYLWNHIAATYDGSELRLYVNGELKSSKPYTGGISLNTDSLFLGKGFLGEMDEVRIWSTALSETTVRDWMCKKLNSSHPSITDLQAYYKFDLGSGTVLADSSGNGLHGNLLNAPMWGLSSVPLGDESTWTYSLGSLQISGNSGDSLQIHNFQNSPPGAHLYLVNQRASNLILQNGNSQYSELDSSHYFGYFLLPTTALLPRCDVKYFYDSNPFYLGHQECEYGMAARPQANYSWWLPIFAVQDMNLNTLSYANNGRLEFVPGLISNPYGYLAVPGQEACQGDSVLLLTGNGANLSYQWFLDGNPITGSNNDSLFVSLSGFYQVAVTDPTCTYTTDSLEINILSLPQINIVNPNLSLLECDSVLDLASNASPAGGNFSGPGLNGNEFTTALVSPGIYTMLYSYTDSNLCSSSDSFGMELLADPLVHFQIILDTFCLYRAEDPFFALHGLGLPTGGIYAGDGISGTSFDPELAGPGTATITYSYTTGTCVFTLTDSIWVRPGPVPPVITQSGDTLFSSDTATFWYQEDAGGDLYLGQGPYWVLPGNGSFYGIGQDSLACYTDASNLITGLEQPLARSARMYPIPNSGKFQLKFANPGRYKIKIRGLSGRIIFRSTGDFGSGKTLELDISSEAEGVYFLELENDFGQQQFFRFVKI